VYGKRTTLYDKHVFNKETGSFYREEFIDNEVYNKSEEYWRKPLRKI
jgi:hypothetical protein